MGSNESKTEKEFDDSNDPCVNHLKSYLKCVEKHENGLSEGDECLDESESYRLCRKSQKKISKS